MDDPEKRAIAYFDSHLERVNNSINLKNGSMQSEMVSSLPGDLIRVISVIEWDDAERARATAALSEEQFNGLKDRIAQRSTMFGKANVNYVLEFLSEIGVD